jgi:hypothetical protein
MLGDIRRVLFRVELRVHPQYMHNMHIRQEPTATLSQEANFKVERPRAEAAGAVGLSKTSDLRIVRLALYPSRSAPTVVRALDAGAEHESSSQKVRTGGT